LDLGKISLVEERELDLTGRRAAVAVILAATAASLATAIIDRPTALSAVLGGRGLGGAGRGSSAARRSGPGA
jgi:hypothetical protein